MNILSLKKKKIFKFNIKKREINEAKDSLNLIKKKLYNKFEIRKLRIDIKEYLYTKNFKIFPHYFLLHF